MIITLANIDSSPVPNEEKTLLRGLLSDVEDINKLLEENGHEKMKLHIEFQDYHNEYSPERVDPCPDFYGYYSIHTYDNTKTIGIHVSIDVLDVILCSILEFLENLWK